MTLQTLARRLALAGAAALLLAAPAWAAGPHDGAWAGILKTPNGQQLHLVLHMATTGSDTAAELESLDQGGVTLPASAVKWDGDKASILFLQMGAEIEGKFEPDGQTFTGSLNQGLAMPLVLKRSAEAPAKP